jgi:predicted ATPase
MREAIDAASSVAIGPATDGADRAVASIEHVERVKRKVDRFAIALLVVAAGLEVLLQSDYADSPRLGAIGAGLFGFALGMLVCGVKAGIEVGRSSAVLKARSKFIASIPEGQVRDAAISQYASGKRYEGLYQRNLSASFKIKQFELHEADIFHDLSWNLEPGINVLLGPNGFGKSFLLRLLVGMVSYDNDRLGKLLSNPDEDQRLAALLLRNDEPVTIERGKVSFDEAEGKIPLLAISDSRFVNRARNSISAEGDDYADLARYGAHHFLYELPYDTTIQTVLAQMCIDVVRRVKRRGPPTSPQLDLVSGVIRELSGEHFRFDSIEPIGSARFSIQIETDSSPGKPISIQQASQGTLSVVAICLLIYQYLRAVYPSVAEAKLCEQVGMVIIDEVDAHLHPAWQRKIAHLLRKRFPKIQFILTAHSPLVVAGCGHGEVAVLRRDSKGLRIVDLQRDFVGATAQDIYRDVFEIEDQDPEFLGFQAELPRLPEHIQELQLLKAKQSTDPADIYKKEETIRAIARTRDDQKAKLDYEALERENAQLQRQRKVLEEECSQLRYQIEALQKRDGSEGA